MCFKLIIFCQQRIKHLLGWSKWACHISGQSTIRSITVGPNEPLWLVVDSHMIGFNQSECFILIIAFVYDIGFYLSALNQNLTNLIKAGWSHWEQDILQHWRPVYSGIDSECRTIDQSPDVVRIFPDLEHGRMIVTCKSKHKCIHQKSLSHY